jgi:hypothetical protein
MNTNTPKRRITDYYHKDDNGVVHLNKTTVNGVPYDEAKFNEECAKLEKLLADYRANRIAEGKPWPPKPSRYVDDSRIGERIV